MTMLRVGEADGLRMREQLLFDGPEASAKLSQFWTLLAGSRIPAVRSSSAQPEGSPPHGPTISAGPSTTPASRTSTSSWC